MARNHLLTVQEFDKNIWANHTIYQQDFRKRLEGDKRFKELWVGVYFRQLALGDGIDHARMRNNERSRPRVHEDGAFLIRDERRMPKGMTLAYFDARMRIIEKFGWFKGELFL